MERAARLGRQEIHALKALVALAQDPNHWRSVTALATQQDLPAPMLEKLLLRLRRAGLLEARRGRLGGYRLSKTPASINLATVLRAVTVPPASPQGRAIAVEAPAALAITTEQEAADRVAAALERRLQRALERELGLISLEDLLFDLRSSQASLEDDGGLMLP